MVQSERNLGKPTLNAATREYEGYLIFGGARNHVKFNKKGVSWKKMTTEKSKINTKQKKT